MADEGLAGMLPPGCPWVVSSQAARERGATLRFAASLADAMLLADRVFVYGAARAEHAVSGERWERRRRRWQRVRPAAPTATAVAPTEAAPEYWWQKL